MLAEPGEDWIVLDPVGAPTIGAERVEDTEGVLVSWGRMEAMGGSVLLVEVVEGTEGPEGTEGAEVFRCKSCKISLPSEVAGGTWGPSLPSEGTIVSSENSLAV
jgi:hypothetical protein